MSAASRPRILVNAAGSTSGGGRTYVLAMLRELLERGDRGLTWRWLVEPGVAERFRSREGADVNVVARPDRPLVARLLWEQLALPAYARRSDFDVLMSAANFAPLMRRQRTVLLARNALHFDAVRVEGPRRHRYMAESALARASVVRTRVTVTATETMASLVQERTTRRPLVIPFGPGLALDRVPADGQRMRFLHRTTWGAHKGFDVLLRAVRELAGTHAGRFVLRTACDPSTPFAREFQESALHRKLLAEPSVAAHVEVRSFATEEAALVPGDAVVMPSTLESFCFPLAEGIGLSLPIVAAESAFARELCGSSAIYVDPRDPCAFAEGMRRILDGAPPPPPGPEVRERLSWRRHADRLAALCAFVAQHDRAPSPEQLGAAGPRQVVS